MDQPVRWGLIGHGNIGREVMRQLAQPAVAERLGLLSQPEIIVTRNGIMQSDGVTASAYKTFNEISDLPDVLFVAIPSSDDGQAAYSYINYALQQGRLIITAEKGALANNFADLKEQSDNFKHLGITATVGGGTRLLHVAREYSQDIGNITQIHLALNGTLAAIMDWVAPVQGAGLALDEAAEKAVAAGYAEPGSSSAAAIIKGEAEGDIPKKLAIFYNIVGLGSLLDWQDLRFDLSEDEIASATQSETPRRFIVSIYPLSAIGNNVLPENDIIGGFKVDHDGWRMVGGFRRHDANPMFGPLSTLTGPGNGIVIGLGPRGTDGIYSVTGPGAGVNPTVNTMLDDFVRLKNLTSN